MSMRRKAFHPRVLVAAALCAISCSSSDPPEEKSDVIGAAVWQDNGSGAGTRASNKSNGGAGGTSGAAAATPPANAAAGGATSQAGPPTPAIAGKTFYVKDGELFDTCGERVGLRGVNHPTLYVDRQGAALPEIAKTGANAVRLFWYATRGVSIAAAEPAISAAIDNKLLPILEMHDSTCEWALEPVVDAWTAPNVVEMIKRYESRMIINIANEASAPDLQTYISGYSAAITRMRAAGIHVPLMVDAPSCGRDAALMRKAAPELLKADPDHNLLFSLHLYQPLIGNEMATIFEGFVGDKLALVIGEFANKEPPGCGRAIDYKGLTAAAQKHGVGWLAWSWGDNDPNSSWNSDCTDFDMTQTFSADTLQGWGKEVALTLPDSIKNTSKRPQSIALGYCSANPPSMSSTSQPAAATSGGSKNPNAASSSGGSDAHSGHAANSGDVAAPANPPMMAMIDGSLLPRGSAGVATRKLSMTDDKPVMKDGVGAFRTVCEFSHMNYDDPIVYPGQPGKAHLHTYFGNTSVVANTTPASLRTTGNSTCRGGVINRSAYWVPALLDHLGRPVKPEYMDVYYKSGYNGLEPDEIKWFPKGLRMVAGDQRATAPQGNAYWGCRDHYIGRVGNIPDCPAEDKLAMIIEFPQCWDGKNLDSDDHRSHMSFPNNGACPSTHPVAIPAITFNIYYNVSNGGSDGYRLSSDMYDSSMPGGYSIHGDWFEAWDRQIVLTFVTRCIRQGLDCHSHLLGDGRAME